MGVPAFFKWLSDKYNKIVSHCIEEKGKVGENGERESVDIGKENPNGVEFDNLYLDMNGIIHPCTHPEHKAAPGTEEEMMVEIFAYIDRVMSVVRPRRVLYLAVDGVAPRAKMNQQRSRRFRAGKEARERTVTLATLRQELLLKGAILPEPKPASQHFDSNCITPGTPFMSRLSLALQYFIYMKLNSDSGWANIQVILSDASAPGEGEHKIMDYIRRQRASPTHDPNTKHCLCGADADLIMLGLATHEPYFTIIREEFKPNQPKPCELCGQLNHSLNECQGLESLEFNVGVNNVGAECEFIFIHINILREYLQVDLFMNDLPFKYDFERAIDDWVFMCFFVGNDFLPHLPSLEIREKAIDTLIALYKKAVYKTKGWLTDSGIVNLERVQMIMKDLALAEDEIFQNRRNREMDFRKKGKSRRMSSKRQRIDQSQYFNVNKNIELVRPNMGEKFSKSSAIEAAHAAMTEPTLNQFGKRKFDVVEEDDEDIRNKELDKRDEVKLWEEGYRTRYYQSKFGVSVTENPEFCVNVAHQYVRGLCWVLAYYYQGCPSWTWYYPYHYAPFAIDFLNVVDTDVSFTANSKPFNPLEQLMGVFPADSKDHIPPAWHSLMTDSESPVIDFYPIDFKIDLNGKRFDWQGVALLPFVDETRLLPALEMFYDKLTDEEIERNVRGPDRYFVKSSHPMATLMKVVHEDSSDTVLDPALSNGVTGRIWKDEKSYLPGDVVKSAVKDLCDDICDIKVISCFYQDPQYTESFIFPATLLKNLTMPPVTLGPDAIRIERQNRKSFDTRPMNRMVRHSLGEGNNSSSDQSRQYGFSPFFDKKPLSLGFNSVETNSNKSYHEGLYQKGNKIGQYQQRDNSIQRSNNQGNNNAMYQQREYSQGNYQQRGNNQGQYQQRGNNQGQYQQNGNNYGQYQQSSNNQGQYQQRGNNQGQYQQRGNNQGQYQQRGNNQVQYQQRGNSQGQYRQENNRGRM